MNQTEPNKLSAPAVVLILIAAVAGAIVVGRWISPAEQNNGTQNPAVGTTLTDLKFAPLTGDPPPLSSESLRGKVTLINLWATWCGPCREEFPHLIALNERLRDQPDYQFISLSGGVDTNDGLKEKTEKFLVSQQTTMPTWYDVDGSTEDRIFTATGNQRAIPLTVLLDKAGKIRGVWRGFVRGDDVEMERLIRAALDEKTT